MFNDVQIVRNINSVLNVNFSYITHQKLTMVNNFSNVNHEKDTKN